MKMCSKVDQTATLSPQDNYFPEVLENCKEICYNVENAKAKWRKPDERSQDNGCHKDSAA